MKTNETKTEKTVLITDDEAKLRSLLRLEFELEGWKVFEAESARRAIEVMASNRIDLLVTDNRMPGGSGIDLIYDLRMDGSKLPMILITAFSDLNWEETLDHGADLFLIKPFPPQSLVAQGERLCMPPQEAWKNLPPEKPTREIVLELDSFESAINNRVISPGRRGFYLNIKQGFPAEGEWVRFALKFARGVPETFQGIGRAEWVRSHDNDATGTLLKSGVGIRIEHLDAGSMVSFLGRPESMRSRASVPKN